VVKRAETFVRERKLDQAAAEYRALVEENPGDSGAANSLGDLYARLGDPVRAIEQYTNLGESEWLQGFSAKAAAFYKKALKVDPNCETALLRLGEIAASQSLRVDAARHWKRLLERRRLRGDAAGEAEVAGWLTDLEGARATRRQATSVGMTPRVEPPAIPELAVAEPAAQAQPVTPDPAAAVPMGEADPSEAEISGQVPWEAALLAAPSETRPSMAVALAAMPAEDMPLVVEQFGQLSEVPANLSSPPEGEAVVLFEPSLASPERGGRFTVNGAPTDGDPAQFVERGEAHFVAGATADPGRATRLATDGDLGPVQLRPRLTACPGQAKWAGPQTGPFWRLRSKLSGESGTMRCKQSVRLTPQHSLHLVELGRQRFLLACHPGGATLLPGEICKEAHGESGIAA
jgi:tetratricopeptide (TPR) repeat protein